MDSNAFSPEKCNENVLSFARCWWLFSEKISAKKIVEIY
jgi:hypothetical protein